MPGRGKENIELIRAVSGIFFVIAATVVCLAYHWYWGLLILAPGLVIHVRTLYLYIREHPPTGKPKP